MDGDNHICHRVLTEKKYIYIYIYIYTVHIYNTQILHIYFNDYIAYDISHTINNLRTEFFLFSSCLWILIAYSLLYSRCSIFYAKVNEWFRAFIFM
jgi:hypothetical protein